jgi:hypothetical protein
MMLDAILAGGERMICDKCIKQGSCNYLPIRDHNDPEESCKLFAGKVKPSTGNWFADGIINAIADSGNRTEFPTGAVRDMHEGKGRMDLLPWAAIIEVSKHCERGAVKYGERNIDKGVPAHSLLDSALRHLAKYMEGAKDEPHLVSAAWNILWAVQFEQTKPEMQDIPARKAE